MNHDTSRLRHYFPIANWVIQNVWLLLPVFAIAAIGVAPLSVHYSLSLLAIWMGILCFWVDRRHLNYLLITPLVPAAVVLMMNAGIGTSFVIFDSPTKFRYGLFVAQLVFLGTFPLFIAGYWCFMRSEPGFVFPKGRLAQSQSFRFPVLAIGWILVVFEFVKVFVGVVTGVSDRGYGGDFVLDTPFGFWTIFGIFLRVQTLAFLLVPYVFRESRMPGKLAVVAVVLATLFLHFISASRGAVFFPIIILMVGAYLFLDSKKFRYEPVFALALVLIIPLITLMAHYRSTAAFRESSVRDIGGRLAALDDGLRRQQDFEAGGEKWSEAGRSFIGVADNLIYEMTPGAIPHVGFSGMSGVIWVWVPYVLYRDRPILQDGKFIAEEYLGYELVRTSVGITWPAEMFRRFGWLGPPLGMLAYGLFYGAAYRWAFRLYHRKNAVLGFLVIGVFCHFLISWYFHTFLNTAWYWLYDMPKNLAFIAVLYYAFSYMVQARRVPGAIELARRQRIEDEMNAPPPVPGQPPASPSRARSPGGLLPGRAPAY